MNFWDGLTRNWAEIKPDHADPALRPIVCADPPPDAIRKAVAIIRSLPNWSVVEVDASAGTVHATHSTRLWGFVDDIRLRFEPNPAGGTWIVGRSQSRLGKADLGQNARNLRELAGSLRDASR